MSPQDSIIGRIIASISPPKNNGVVGRLVLLPPSLQNTTQTQSIEGEVVQQYKDGNLRVRTAQGDVEISVRDRKAPQVGDRVQLDIPKGNPPRQAVVRPGTDIPRHQITAPAQQNQTQTPQQVQNPIPTQQAAPPTSSSPVQTTPQTAQSAPASNQAPVQTNAPQALPERAAPLPEQVVNAVRETTAQAPAQKLEAGQVVRLLPITPAQVQKTVQPFPQQQTIQTSLPQQVITRATFQANLIAQSVQSNLETQAIQIGKTSIEQVIRTLNGTSHPTQTQAVASNQGAVQATITKSFLPVTPPSVFPAPASSAAASAVQPIQNLITQLLNFQSPSPAVPQPALNAQQPLALQSPVQIIPPQVGSSLAVQATQITAHPALTNAINLQTLPQTITTPVLTNTTQVAQAASLPLQAPVIQQTQTPGLNAQIFSVQTTSVQITPPASTPNQVFTNVITQVQNPAFQIVNSSPQTVPAIVIGTTPQNLPVITVQTQALSLPQTFTLQSPVTNVQSGTQIQIRPQTLSVLTQPALTQVSSGSTAQGLPLPQLLRPGPWPIMDELYQGLMRVSPQAAQSLSQSIPNPVSTPGQLTPSALMFVAAVRSGDFASWLGGKSIEALQRIGKGNLPTRLGNELSSLNRGDAPVGEWRAVPLPMFWQGEIQKITLYTRQGHDGQSGDDEGDKQTRFVFDLDLTRMGPVQLDGLIKGQRLDLIVRTEVPFSEAMRQRMRQAYSDALHSTELHGELDFQGDTKHWVNVLQKDEAFGASA